MGANGGFGAFESTSIDAWRRFVDHFPDAISLFEPVDAAAEPAGFRYVYANAMAAALTGFATDVLVGKTIAEVHGDFADEVDAALRAAFTSTTGAITHPIDATDRLIEIVALRVGDLVFGTTRNSADALAAVNAEDQLREALVNSLEPLTICSAVRDEQGEIVALRVEFMNRAGLDLAQLDDRDVIGRDLSVVQPTYRDRIEGYRRVIKSGVPESYTVDVQEPRAGRLEIVATRYRDGVLIAGRDVSVASRATAALQRSEERFSRLVEALRELVFVFSVVRGPDGRIVDFAYEVVNEAARRALPDDPTGRTMLEFFPSVRGSELFDRFVQVAQSGEPTLVDAHLITDNGLDRWYESSAVRLGDGLVLVSRDVTERMRDADALRDSERRYRMLADNAGDVVFFGRDGVIDWVGPSITTLFGWTPDELIGNPTVDLVHPDDQPIVMAARARYHLPEPVRFRYRMRRSDGTYVWVEARARPVPDDDGVHRGAVISTVFSVQAEIDAQEALARAEAERRVQEQRLAQASRLESLGVMAGGIAHDFNNLLVGVLGNAELALAALPADAPARQRIERIVSAAQHAADLTRQLLDYAGRRQRVSQAVRLAETVAEVENLVASMLPASISLVVAPPPPWIGVEGDSSQLQQMLVNLVMNAADAMSGLGSGTVRVEVTASHLDHDQLLAFAPGGSLRPGYYATIQVADEGPGMDEATLRRIFEPFFTTRPTGRGLGLAVVHGVARSHGGVVHADSAVGVGTTMVVVLPCVDLPVPVASQAPTTTDQDGAATTVLVVDDDDDVREVSRMVLEHAGMKVTAVGDGPRALAAFDAAPGEYSVVLLDLTMPGMSGDEVLERLRAIDDRVPVVLISGYSDIEMQERMRTMPISGFVKKPFRGEALVSAIRAAARTNGARS